MSPGSGSYSSADADTGSGGPSPLAYVAVGVGVVGVAVGTVFLFQSNNSVDKANELCSLPGGSCPQARKNEIDSLDEDARSQRSLSTVGFVVGGVGLAAGAILFGVTGGKKKTASTKTIQPWVGLGSAGMSGRF